MKKHHLIVAATYSEIKQLEFFIQSDCKSDINYSDINNNIKILVTGIGQYNTIRSLTEHIIKYGKPLSLLNIGIAGTYKNAIPIKTLAKIKKDIAYDQKVIESHNIKDWKEATLPDAISNIFEPILPSYFANINLDEALAVTSDTISDNQDRINQIIQKYHATCESMEGAAVFYMAGHYNIPSMQIRAISNTVGERDKSLWKIKESIEELNRFVIENVLVKLNAK